MSLDLARSIPGVIGDPNVWFLVADADTVALKVNDAIPRVLAENGEGYNVASFGYQQAHLMDLLTGTPENDDYDYGGGRWSLVRRAESVKAHHSRGIYRNVPGLRYGPAHWHVTHGLPGQRRSWLWGGGGSAQEKSLDLTYDLFFEHRRRYRQPGRNEDSQRYYEIRDSYGIEDEYGRPGPVRTPDSDD